MSVVATMQFDPVFNLGGRSNFTWPGLQDSCGDFLGSGLAPYGSELNLAPLTASRSSTASPPRTVFKFSAEGRELKRQRDQYRRENKTATRVRRADSVASSIDSIGSFSQLSPSRSLSDITPTTAMPIFTSAPSQLSLPSESTTTLATSPYMPAAYSLPLTTGPSEHLFPQYSEPASYMPDYSASYSTPSTTSSSMSSQSHGFPSHYHRGSLTAEPPMMYSLPMPMAHQISDAHTHHQEKAVNAGVRVVQSRPKPQCWEHGCNGRQFSTFSNLLRHQREKSGHANKSVCPNCGAEFTRTTARNGHLQHDKCKRRNSE